MIILEKFTRRDFERLIAWVKTEKEMVLFSGPIFSFPLTTVQLEDYINDKNRMVFRVKDLSNGNIIGHAELNKIDFATKTARICRILVGNPEDRNKGYGKQIITQLVSIGFQELGLQQIELAVFDFNQQALTCYQNCGFEIESFEKDVSKVDDEYWSTYTMRILNKKLSN